MEKTETMKKYEQETGEIIGKIGDVGDLHYIEYVERLEAKAAAYDRLMSGEPTAKEIANILNRIIAMDHDGKWHAFCSIPYAKSNYQWIPIRGSSKYRVPCLNIKFDGDWEDSLTLPDGWEEKMITAAKSEYVDIRHSNEAPYPIPYGQHYCPICYGQIDTGFRCIKCGRQFSAPRNNSAATAKDGWEGK